MRSSGLAAVLAALLLVGGCASMVNGPTQTIPVTSDPAGALVFLDDVGAGVTPCKVTLDRKSDHLLVLRKDGHEEYTMELRRTASPWVYGNVFFGGLVGIYSDTQGGAQFQFMYDKIQIQLRPTSTTRPTTQPTTANARP